MVDGYPSGYSYGRWIPHPKEKKKRLLRNGVPRRVCTERRPQPSLSAEVADEVACVPHTERREDLAAMMLYIGIADGMSIARVWACRYSK